MKNNQTYMDDLAQIRSMMERSTRFLSLSGLSGIFAGILAITGGLFAWWYMKDIGFLTGSNAVLESGILMEKLARFIFIDGLIVLVLALISAVYFSWLKAKRRGIPVWDFTTKRVLVNLGIPLLAGGIFTMVLMLHNQLYLVAPVTLLFYGLALLNAGNFTLSEVRYLGILEIVTGILACLFLRYGLYFWIFGFGILHVMYGSLMYYRYDVRAEDDNQ